MRKVILIMAVLVVLVGLSGCMTPNQAFVAALDESWGLIGPDYVTLVQASGRDPDTIRIQVQHANSLTALIETARGGD